jgi:hypothetical protein
MQGLNQVRHRLLNVLFVITPVLLEPFPIIIALQRTEELKSLLRENCKGAFPHGVII